MGLVAATRTGRAKSYSNESFFFFCGVRLQTGVSILGEEKDSELSEHQK